MKCIIIPINRSDYVFESSFSSIVRSYELFRPGRMVILYAEFNKVHLQKLKSLIDELKSKEVDVRYKELNRESFQDFKKLIEDETKSCEETYLVPTSGANIIAVYLALLHSQNGYPLVNYLFSFGPWTRYYYPFVPRSLENVLIIGNNQPNNVKFDLNLDSYLDNTLFTKIIESTAKKLNEKLPVERDELALKLKGKVVFSTDSPDYEELLDELKIIYNSNAKNILNLSGAYEILVDDNKRIEEEAYGRALVIDTNLVYYGIHTHEIKDLVVPYCVHNEVLWKVNDKRDTFYNAIFHVYEALREKVRIIPSEPTICDVSIPKMEPDLIKDSLVVTGDRRAFNRWNELAIHRYADLKLAKLGTGRSDYAGVSSVIFNLAAILSIMQRSDVEVCWKSYDCVKVDNAE